MINPSLREEPLHERPAPRIGRQRPSFLDWLESEGRLLSREPEVAKTSVLEEPDEIFLDDFTEVPEEDFMEDAIDLEE